ncbi:hypothetical protein [Pseudoalteromonas sp. SR43-5]|uniref:hypothetical protein n=1 Tax=Pseudoalteromonas sp. SR43-5 TaxID=2760941 RepID=UPI0015FDB88B|nr:hypothetical protein [Pseudoalteromonas sp. SR43-5]MBB1307280.1 hypothetical protein [Pseudoalteromonas sp. SR43-5]
MAKQSYKKLKITAVKTSLAQLFLDNGLTVPAGDVTFELQNANTQGLIYVSFGDQSALSDFEGNPIPAYWKTDEVESFANVFIQSGAGLSDSAITVTVTV